MTLPMGKKILIIDDRPEWIHTSAELFREEGYQVNTLRDPLKALETFIRFKPDAVLLDFKMPEKDGFEVLKEIRRRDKHVCVVMLSAYGDSDTVVRAMKSGADYFVDKAADPKKALIVVEKELEHKAVQFELARLKARRDPAPSTLDDIIGESEAIARVKQSIREAAGDDRSVLLIGETGVGKDLAASAIHNASARRKGPFHNVICTAIPPDLFESAIFGSERGAFTGADSRKQGVLESASGGTVLLNEFVKIPRHTQASLLGVLDTGDFSRVGGASHVLRSDVKFLAATNQSIVEALRQELLLDDLYHRLNHHRIQIPPLRERTDDIVPLAQLFIGREARERNRPVVELSGKSWDILMKYHWPGNVRELKQLMANIVQAGSEDILRGYDFLEDPDDLRRKGGTPGKVKDKIKQEQSDVERRRIAQALSRFGGNRKKTASYLGMSYRALMYKMKKYELREIF